jgi:hypothetical protein
MTARHRGPWLLLAAAVLAPGCGRGGGDLDHPHTLDVMVREAREPWTERPAPGQADARGAAAPTAAPSTPG